MVDYKEVERPRHYQKMIASFIEEKEVLEYQTTVPYLTFLLSGTIEVCIDGKKIAVFDKPTMFLVPKHKQYKRMVLQRAHILPFPLGPDVLNFSLFSFVKEQFPVNPLTYVLSSLSIKESLIDLLILFAESFSFSYLDATYYKLKLTELLYLIRKYYSTEEVIAFFSSIIDDDFRFSDFVMNNYKQAKQVKDLVELSSYSLSDFESRFERVFGHSPALWLKEQKKAAISKDLFYTNKTLKQIGFEYGFYSPAHFNNYCKSAFGMSPGEMRKKE